MLSSPPLGRLLMDAGILTQATLDEVLAAQRADKRRLGELLVERGIATPLQLAQMLSRQLSCPWISLTNLDIAPEIIALLPAETAIERRAVPVYLRETKDKRVLYVATDDPSDEVSLAYCAAEAGMPVRAMIAVTGEVLLALSRFYDAPLPEQPAGAEADVSTAPATPRRSTTPRRSATPRRSTTPGRGASLAPHSSDDAMTIDDADLEEVLEPPPREARAPTLLTLNVSEQFGRECEGAAKRLGARLVMGGIQDAGELVAEHRPCAIIVDDNVYAFDSMGLNRLALEHDAHLVVWREDVDSRQLEPLLDGAIDRWGRASYEKGAILDGRYEMLRDLGASPYGTLWEVRNVRTAKRSVLALALRSQEDEEVVAAIRRTHRALARILHPGAPALRDAGITELGDPYVVLEPIEGRTLDGLLAARGGMSPAEACAIALQLADILAAAHGMGVLHNDVVGAKVLIGRDGYGVERARLVGWDRATVNARDAFDPHGDIAAIATCMFESLVGRRPAAEEPTAAEGMPAPVAALIARALRRPDTKAIETMAELSEAIAEVEPGARDGMRLLDSSVTKRTAAAPPSTPPAATGAVAERRHPRGAYRTPVRIEVPGEGLLDGKSEDISIGGLLVVAKGDIDAGTEVTIRFALPLDGKVIAEAAVVKWSRTALAGGAVGLRAIGVELMDPSPETLRQVEKYVSLMGDGTAA